MSKYSIALMDPSGLPDKPEKVKIWQSDGAAQYYAIGTVTIGNDLK